MKIEIVLTESEIAQEIAESMEARDLPEKSFYWFTRSVQAWLALSGDGSYEPLNRCWQTVAESIAAVTAHFPAAVPVISLGSGEGARDRMVLKALRDAGRDVRYFPVDASQPLLELACAAAEDDDIETSGIKADISSPVHLVYCSDAAEPPRLFLMAGGTLGSFDPLDQIRHLAQSMREGDRLVVDGEIHGESTLKGRTEPIVVRWATAPFDSMGITPEDGELRLEERHDERHEGLHLVVRHFRANRDVRAMVFGNEIPMQRGERISMNFQYVYDPKAFRWLIEEHAGLKLVDAIPSPDGRFLAAVCSK